MTLKDFLSRPINENPDQFLNRTQELIASANGVPFTQRIPASTIIPVSKEPSLRPKASNGKSSSLTSKPPRNLNGSISQANKDVLQQGSSVLVPPVFFSSIASSKPPVSKFASDLDEAASLAQALLSGVAAFSPASSILLPKPSVVAENTSSKRIEASGYRGLTSVQATMAQAVPQASEALKIKDWLIQQQSGVMQSLFSHMLGDIALHQTHVVNIRVPKRSETSDPATKQDAPATTPKKGRG
jgi:hypothetical protein